MNYSFLLEAETEYRRIRFTLPPYLDSVGLTQDAQRSLRGATVRGDGAGGTRDRQCATPDDIRAASAIVAIWGVGLECWISFVSPPRFGFHQPAGSRIHVSERWRRGSRTKLKHKNAINTDSKKQRPSVALLFTVGYGER